MSVPVIYFMDGYNHYTDLSLKYNSQYGNNQASAYATAPAISSTAARNGAGGLLLTNGGLVYKTLPDLTTMGIGFSFRFTTNPPAGGRRMISLRDEGVENLYLYLTSARHISIINHAGASLGTSSATFNVNTWYFLEFSVTFGASGSYSLKLDNTQDISASGVATNGTSSNRCNFLQMGASALGNYPFHYDDLYVSDGSLIGPVYVDDPPNSGTYPVTSPSASNSQVNLTDFIDLSGSGAVFAVAVHTPAHKQYGNTRAIRNVIAISGAGTQYVGSDHYLTTTDFYHSDIFSTNPNTAGTWTVPTFNSAQIGFVRIK